MWKLYFIWLKVLREHTICQTIGCNNMGLVLHHGAKLYEYAYFKISLRFRQHTWVITRDLPVNCWKDI